MHEKPTTKIGRMLRLYRASRALSVRELSRECGLSHATLNRIERGYPMAADTMIDLWIWLTRQDKAL